MLWEKIIRQNQHALAVGALHPIPTTYEYLENSGINFVVRISSDLERKKIAIVKQGQKNINPFLPYEEDLFVENLSDTHVCLLNKFNVVDHHILIITKAFERQDTLLTLQDFIALWICLGQVDGLAFYNGGKLAGASQHHKHLQLIPLSPSAIPVTEVIESTFTQGRLARSPVFPFVHAIVHYDLEQSSVPSAILARSYQTLLDVAGCGSAYNLLITKTWMLLVPRRKEKSLEISLNSLGFAGCFFVSNKEYFKKLAHHGPLNLLADVSYSL